MGEVTERGTHKATARNGGDATGGDRKGGGGAASGVQRAAATELLQKLPAHVISRAQACGFLALATLL